jgi:NAD+ synthase (glutamine-hydrolysing)
MIAPGRETIKLLQLRSRGRVLGVVRKTYLPTYREFYEARHFGSGGTKRPPVLKSRSARYVEANDVPGLVIGVDMCEDMWIPVTPGTELARFEGVLPDLF